MGPKTADGNGALLKGTGWLGGWVKFISSFYGLALDVDPARGAPEVSIQFLGPLGVPGRAVLEGPGPPHKAGLLVPSRTCVP